MSDLDQYQRAVTKLDSAAGIPDYGTPAERYQLDAAHVHATLAVADRLGQLVDRLDELGRLFAAKVADIDSAPYPEVQQPGKCAAQKPSGSFVCSRWRGHLGDHVAYTEHEEAASWSRTWNPGDDEPPADVRVLYDEDSKTSWAWLYRTTTGWAWGNEAEPGGQAQRWTDAAGHAEAPLRDVTGVVAAAEAAREATS
ncbi:hypothetical protein [Prauserella cavernicola]|uniref:Uncharacterized protein n=1 Tax=Prauserella cavernicola TaxID=2800127 RepID=A0A934V5Y4_9PSEU|nr:hypothetical protein [Prauserella cavernicola]MBK1785113.1 hypothetical protein [Prauserella cavernicola]